MKVIVLFESLILKVVKMMSG